MIRRSGDTSQPRATVIDCRWLGYTGVGRVTELLLRGLGELAPAGSWILWGPQVVAGHMWPGATHVLEERSPLALHGQAAVLRMPAGTEVLFLHVVRPLAVRRPTIVLAHDTIPVRWSKPRQRALQHLFYVLSCRTASTVLSYSDATEARLRQDLGVRPERIRRVPLTVDLALTASIRHLRPARRRGDRLLYVGLWRAHKNLERAIRGFGRSALCAAGGSFFLIGLDEAGREILGELVRSLGIEGVHLQGRCSEEELIDHYAAATLVIQPSLEEGFGLTVLEALAGGVPVVCSAGGAMEEAANGLATLFDPTDEASIADAIDATAQLAQEGRLDHLAATFDATVTLPSPIEFAEAVVAAVRSTRR